VRLAINAEFESPEKLPQEFDEHVSSHDAAVMFGRAKVADRCDFLRDHLASVFHEGGSECCAGK
jgi:hypothetical protein